MQGRLLGRRALGYAWLGIWVVVLCLVAAPWRDLGGIVDERLRWLERLVLLTGIPIGFTIGQLARDLAIGDPRWTHLRVWKLLLVPPAAATAASLVVLRGLERGDAIGVVTSGFLAYWAGLDSAFGAVPLLWGRSCRFGRPLDPE